MLYLLTVLLSENLLLALIKLERLSCFLEDNLKAFLRTLMITVALTSTGTPLTGLDKKKTPTYLSKQAIPHMADSFVLQTVH